jgi:hypothetical protein
MKCKMQQAEREETQIKEEDRWLPMVYEDYHLHLQGRSGNTSL